MRKVVLNLWFLTAIAFLLTILAVNDARGELPLYVDVTFTDIADLDARTDSVLAVCDTIWYLSQEFVDSLWEHHGVDVNNPQNITCRHFVGREIWRMPKRYSITSGPVPGDARIWFEERRR